MTEQTDKLDNTELLRSIEKSARSQLRYARLQCFFAAVAAICCIALFLTLNTLMPQIRHISAQLETVLNNLETVTSEISALDITGIINSAESDIGAMVENVDSLVNVSHTGVEETLKKLNSIDFEKLSRAISDFSAVAEKLSGIFGVFG